MLITFDEQAPVTIDELKLSDGQISVPNLKNEPMLYSAGWQFAWDNGGPITHQFLRALREHDDTWLQTLIDGNGQLALIIWC